MPPSFPFGPTPAGWGSNWLMPVWVYRKCLCVAYITFFYITFTPWDEYAANMYTVLRQRLFQKSPYCWGQGIIRFLENVSTLLDHLLDNWRYGDGVATKCVSEKSSYGCFRCTKIELAWFSAARGTAPGSKCGACQPFGFQPLLFLLFIFLILLFPHFSLFLHSQWNE